MHRWEEWRASTAETFCRLFSTDTRNNVRQHIQELKFEFRIKHFIVCIISIYLVSMAHKNKLIAKNNYYNITQIKGQNYTQSNKTTYGQ